MVDLKLQSFICSRRRRLTERSRIYTKCRIHRYQALAQDSGTASDERSSRTGSLVEAPLVTCRVGTAMHLIGIKPGTSCRVNHRPRGNHIRLVPLVSVVRGTSAKLCSFI